MKNKKYLLILIAPLVLALVTLIVMWLWNLLLPEILGVKAISFWQAMGILVLSKILFGGFRGGGGKFRRFKERHCERKTDGMSDEEKEKLKEIWRKKCGTGFFNREKN